MSDKLVFYVLTDTHYLSERMWEECKCITDREMGDQIAIKSTPYILRSFFKKIVEDDECSWVLITGDLINNGDLQSHRDFIAELKMLTDAGKKVLVTGATHDYAGLGDDENIFHPVKYTSDGCVPAERVYKTELPELYFDFGHKYADSTDAESGSYSVRLGQGLRLIAIYDNGNGRSHCGLFDEGFLWLENEIKKAHAEGERVALAVHHPVIPPWPVYKGVAEFELLGGYERMSRLMCENDVKVIFTGHTHVHGIKKYEDEYGRGFYDITTSALPSAKGKMRRVVFDGEKNTLDVKSVGIEKIDGFDTKGLSAEEYIYSLNFAGLAERSLPLARTDWDTFIENMSHVVNVDRLKIRNHPRTVKAVISVFSRLSMYLPARFAGKKSGLSAEEIKNMKNKSVKDTAFTVMRYVFSGNAPFTPDTAEYKVITGCVKKGTALLGKIGVDVDKMIPGEETALETVKHFLYNTRTGDDDSITIDMER